MFKNRKLEVKVVKNKDENAPSIPAPTVEDYVKIVDETGKKAVIAAGALIVTYVLSDTFRQAAVAIVKAKI